MKFFKKLKQLFFHSHLSNLKVGDIILARRYHNDQERDNIEEGHRESPFIIIKKTLFKVYGLECSSILGNVYSPLLKLKIASNKYKIKKDSYVYLGRLDLLDKSRFITKIDSLDSFDLNRIYKGIYLVNKYIKSIKLPNFKFTYDIGDIIEYNQFLYYIQNIDKDNFYGYMVKEGKKNPNSILINHENYNLQLNKRCIPKSKIGDLVNTTDERIQEIISVKYQKLVKDFETRFVVNRGKLVVVNNNLYYIYGEYQNFWLVYKIYLKNSHNYFQIKINNGYYYTLFEEEKINKNSKINVKRVANDGEMSVIKKLRNELRLKSKKKNNVVMCKKLKIRTVILDLYSLDQYIIVDRGCDYIVLSPYDGLDFFIHNLKNDACFEVVETYDYFKFKKLKDYYEKFVNKKRLKEYKR